MLVLESLLEREVAQIQRFISALQDEQAILKTAVPEGLEAVQAVKSELVAELNDLAFQRNVLMGLRESTDRQAIASWFTTHPGNERSQTHWRNLLDLAREARTLSELNGQLITLHLQRTNEALDILTQRHRESAVYGSNGQATFTTGSRIIDSA